MAEVNHFRRLALFWLVCTVILTPIVVILLGSAPPGRGTVESNGQVIDNQVLLGLATPFTMAVVCYLLYATFAFRERQPELSLDGPAIRGNPRVQTIWLMITTSTVLFLAGYGTVRLLSDGSGGGQGPSPIATPSASIKPLQVQVIAQQWKFSYRWPGYGGVQTPTIVLPEHRTVEFHVTSLDVIHSFWATQLGVKADANPGYDNVAYVTTQGPLHFNIRCVELCGVWHGYMYSRGVVVPQSQFDTWIAGQKSQYGSTDQGLGPYAPSYNPAPQRRGG